MMQHIQAFNQLKKNYTDLLQLVSSLDPVQLNYAPAPDKWSCGQIMDHLHLSFNYSIIYLNKKVNEANALPDAGLKSLMRYWIIKFVLNSPIKIKAPKNLDKVAATTEISTIEKGVLSNLAALEEFVLHYPASLQRKAIFKHPLAGRINLLQTIRFLNEHLMHHDRQIRQIIAQHHG